MAVAHYYVFYVAVQCLFSIPVYRYGLGTSFSASLFFGPFVIQQMEIVSLKFQKHNSKPHLSNPLDVCAELPP